MKTLIFYYTSTGNSLFASRVLAEELDDTELVNILSNTQYDDYSYNAERIGFVFPIYAGGIPPVVDEFVKRIHLNKDAYIFAVYTASSTDHDGPFAMLNLALGKHNNPKLSLATQVLAPNNDHSYGIAPEDENRQRLDDLAAAMKTFAARIAAEEKAEYPNVLDREVKTHYNEWLEESFTMDDNFIVNDNCTTCGTCYAVCPARNIQIVNDRPVFFNRCFGCYGCINACPVNAIDFTENTIGKPRYHNPYVSVEDLYRPE